MGLKAFSAFALIAASHRDSTTAAKFYAAEVSMEEKSLCALSVDNCCLCPNLLHKTAILKGAGHAGIGSKRHGLDIEMKPSSEDRIKRISSCSQKIRLQSFLKREFAVAFEDEAHSQQALYRRLWYPPWL